MTTRPVDASFVKMLEGYSLTSAEVLYRMPDHPTLLQTFFWQFEDLAPDYPRLKRFLDHWEREIEAIIHSVRVMHAGLIKPREVRLVKDAGHLH
ncbi:usg protein [Aurantimonas sp. VKM B-3413]|uniref:usg protein n=1 Tax=Aurantimonas sp. VKM B-3413 TaxID=2779401 RepID=UPI001E49E41C|nr:usg protein [Aurantimonas sp. VKM B-3413]MCB8839746.1 usg protein [Aurantimonas sp. VKM B-3413]